MNNIHNIFGDMDMKLRGGATRAFFLGRVGLEGRTINNTLSDLEEVFLHFHPNRQALDKLLVTPYSEKGPRTFVAIWHLHKNSIPARLPKDLVKKIVDLSHFDILAELERVAHSQVLVKVA